LPELTAESRNINLFSISQITEKNILVERYKYTMISKKILIPLLLGILVYQFPIIRKHYASEYINNERDVSTGVIGGLHEEELVNSLNNKKVLVIGGTRGIGFGTSVILAKYGAIVYVVGRSVKTGEKTLEELKRKKENPHKFIAADLSTVKGVWKLLTELKSEGSKFDHIVVTAGVWPDWENPLTSDGIEKTVAVMNLGRYIFYKHCLEFLKPGARVLNILTAGDDIRKEKIENFQEYFTGKKQFNSLFEYLEFCTSVNYLSVMEFSNRWQDKNVSLLATHPGFIDTDLHNGQGMFSSVIQNPLFLYLIGSISEFQAGENSAQILSSPKIHRKVTYIDSFMIAREPGPNTKKIYVKQGKEIISYLDKLEEEHK